MFNSFSPNMLKTFELCPKKFYFKYVKKISMPTNDDIFELGKNIHALASYYLKKENLDKMELSLTEKEKPIWEYLKNIEYFSYECLGLGIGKIQYGIASSLVFLFPFAEHALIRAEEAVHTALGQHVQHSVNILYDAVCIAFIDHTLIAAFHI